MPKRISNRKKRGADPKTASSSNPPAKKAKKAVASRKVSQKSESLMTMEKSKYEDLRWNNDPYEDRRRDAGCGPMFRTITQQKIFEEVILALDTKIAPHKAIDFAHIKKNKDKFVNIFETCDRLGLVDIMSFKCDYNEELVMQFYTTFFRRMIQGIFGG